MTDIKNKTVVTYNSKILTIKVDKIIYVCYVLVNLNNTISSFAQHTIIGAGGHALTRIAQYRRLQRTRRVEGWQNVFANSSARAIMQIPHRCACETRLPVREITRHCGTEPTVRSSAHCKKKKNKVYALHYYSFPQVYAFVFIA